MLRGVTLITNKVKKNRINREIRVREVRLINADGEQAGLVSIQDALKAAEEASLDLVEINPTSKPPVCKIMDFGKYRYEQSKKERESRLKRKNIELKEVKVRPKIDVHDYETKKKTVLRLLKGGDKVKVTLMFKGREMAYRKQGQEMMAKMAEELSQDAIVEREPKFEGKSMSMILAPKTQG